MKPIIVAAAAGVLVFLAITLVFRFQIAARAANTIVFLYCVVEIILCITVIASPGDLGFLSPALVTGSAAVDVAFASFIFTAGTFGGILQLYNLADRGFSLRILIDCLVLQDAVTSVEEVMQSYSAGKGIRWMYEKRVEGMVATGLTIVVDESLMLTESGRRAANVFGALRRFTRQPPMAPGSDI